MKLLISMMMGNALAAEAPPKVDAPVATGAERTSDAAVVVGNEVYAYLPKVDFAERDAAATYQTLLTTRGLPPENIAHLDGANRDQILDAVQRAAVQVGDGGTVWVYFAGHGAASPSTGELMLVGDDAKQDPEVFASRSITVGEIADAVDAPLMFVLDTCYAGFGRSGEQLIPGTRFAVPPSIEFERSWPVTMWTAAGPDQISGPYGAARHGLFTYFAMGAMRGWADGELGDKANGEVTLEEAQAYVTRAFTTLQVTGQAPELTAPDGEVVLVDGRKLEPGPLLEELARPAALEIFESEGPKSRIPPDAEGLAWPITHLSGRTFEDAYNVELNLKRELIPIAEYDQDGRDAARWYRGNRAVHSVAIPLGVTGIYSAYVFGWDYTRGHNMEPTASGGLAAASAAVAVGMITWETLRWLRRSEQRTEVLEAANRVVQGDAR